MVHSNRECIQAGTQVLLRVASGRCRVNELTHFLPSNRAESSPTAQTRPHRSWQGRGEGSPSTRLTEPELFDYKASFIYTPGKTAQGKQRRRQRSISRTAADTAGGPRGSAALLRPPVTTATSVHQQQPPVPRGSRQCHPGGVHPNSVHPGDVHPAEGADSHPLLSRACTEQSDLLAFPSSGASLAVVSNQIVVLINLGSTAYTQDK